VEELYAIEIEEFVFLTSAPAYLKNLSAPSHLIILPMYSVKCITKFVRYRTVFLYTTYKNPTIFTVTHRPQKAKLEELRLGSVNQRSSSHKLVERWSADDSSGFPGGAKFTNFECPTEVQYKRG
jgi:hypothetical protein